MLKNEVAGAGSPKHLARLIKDHHLNQNLHDFGFQPLIFQGVFASSFCPKMLSSQPAYM